MSILFVLLGISFLIIIHELGHFWAAKKAGLLVEEFGFGFPPRLFSKKIGETTYSVNALPFGGFVRIFGEHAAQVELSAYEGEERRKRSFSHQSAWRKTVIILAGIAMNFIVGWALMSAVFMIGSPSEVVVTDVLAESPAFTAGVKAGDRIIGFEDSESFVTYINASRGKETSITLERAGEELSIVATPRVEIEKGAFGVAVVDGGVAPMPFFAAVKYGFISSLEVIGEIIKLFGRLVTNFFTKGQVVEDVVGPVGVISVAGEAGERGLVYLFQLLALISLNLAALNAIPFPALDGGRFLFVLIEKIKGSPLNPRKEMYANLAGMAFLFLLMIIITARDIVRLF